jgi:hypothetical protein
MLTQIQMTNEFSVYQYFPDDSYEAVVRFVEAQKAIQVAKQCCTSVGAKIGTTRRVIITDGGDCINFEWIFEKGIVFPTPDTPIGPVND